MCTIIVFSLLIYFTIKIEGMTLRWIRSSQSGPRAKLIADPCSKRFSLAMGTTSKSLLAIAKH